MQSPPAASAARSGRPASSDCSQHLRSSLLDNRPSRLHRPRPNQLLRPFAEAEDAESLSVGKEKLLNGLRRGVAVIAQRPANRFADEELALVAAAEAMCE